MRQLYCIKCKQSFTTSLEKGAPCPTCKEPLAYFGKEAVAVSTQELIEAYDAKHPFNPVGDFRGRTQHYTNPYQALEILECEDKLKKNPEDMEALYHLGKLYKTVNQPRLAYPLLKRLVALKPDHVAPYHHFAELAVHEANFKIALKTLLFCAKVFEPEFITYENIGIVFLYLNEPKKAKKALLKAESLCTDPDKKIRLAGLIEKL